MIFADIFLSPSPSRLFLPRPSRDLWRLREAGLDWPLHCRGRTEAVWIEKEEREKERRERGERRERKRGEREQGGERDREIERRERGERREENERGKR